MRDGNSDSRDPSLQKIPSARKHFVQACVLQNKNTVINGDPDARYNKGRSLGDPEPAHMRIVGEGRSESGIFHKYYVYLNIYLIYMHPTRKIKKK